MIGVVDSVRRSSRPHVSSFSVCPHQRRAVLMSVQRQDWSLHRKGSIDQQRHKEKVREAIKKNLADIVSEENIIMSDGKKQIRVPIRSLDQYRFRYDPGRQTRSGQGNGK